MILALHNTKQILNTHCYCGSKHAQYETMNLHEASSQIGRVNSFKVQVEYTLIVRVRLHESSLITNT